MERTGALRNLKSKRERVDDRPEHRALIRRAGAAGTVLLKNEGLLPLQAEARVAVIGPNARTAQIMGGGSSQLNLHYQVSPWEGLAARVGESNLSYATGCSNRRWEPLLEGNLGAISLPQKIFQGPLSIASRCRTQPPCGLRLSREARLNRASSLCASAEPLYQRRAGCTGSVSFLAGFSRVTVDGQLVANAWDGWTRGRSFFEEGCDEVVGTVELIAGRSHEIEIEFASKQSVDMVTEAFRLGIGRPLGEAEISKAAQVAADADTAVLFIGRSGEWDTEGSDLEDIALPGRQDESVSAVLAANPRTVIVLQTGGPVEMPWVDDAPAILQAWYPGQECGNVIADVLYGDAEPGGRFSANL